MDFDNNTVDISFSGLFNGSIENVSIECETKLITLSPTPEYVEFLDKIPYKLVPDDIVLGFDNDTTVSASVLGMEFNLTRDACT